MPTKTKSKAKVKSKASKKKKLAPKAASPLIEEFNIPGGDLIIGTVDIPNPCEIKISLTKNVVQLQIGPRDWQWNRLTGEHVSSGTVVGQASQESMEETTQDQSDGISQL